MMSCWDNVLKAFHCQTLVRRLFSFRSRCQHSILPLNSRPKKKTHGCGFTVAWTWTPSLWDFTQIYWMRCCFVNVTAAAGLCQSCSSNLICSPCQRGSNFEQWWKDRHFIRVENPRRALATVAACGSGPTLICWILHVSSMQFAVLRLPVHLGTSSLIIWLHCPFMSLLQPAWAFPYLDDNCKCILKRDGKNLPSPRLACINVYFKRWNLTEGRL